MKNQTTITDFKFQVAGHGHYAVIYTSPVTGKEWATITSDMELIDATKNADSPRRCDLEQLKRVCKH